MSARRRTPDRLWAVETTNERGRRTYWFWVDFYGGRAAARQHARSFRRANRSAFVRYRVSEWRRVK